MELILVEKEEECYSSAALLSFLEAYQWVGVDRVQRVEGCQMAVVAVADRQSSS